MRTMQDQLVEKGIVVSLSAKEDAAETKISKRPKEKLSRRELEELMGVNRETYQKQGGAYRRRR